MITTSQTFNHALTPAQLAASGGIQVPAQPPRPTVVLTKIATAFLESGLNAEARTFLQKDIQLSPNGASRTRQSLAKLALAADDPALAERYAREALLMGRFQAKTIASWPLYLDARARKNLTPILEPDVLASFQTIAKGRIASASLHSISRTLRAHGDPTWKALAQSAIRSRGSDPIIATELEKIVQADAKLTGSENPRIIAARALRLFRAKDASAQEQVAHAKAYARFSLLASAVPNTQLITRITTQRYGIAHTATVRHAMALGAIQARNFDLARKWLLALLADLPPGSEAWGKATKAFARMEDLLERHSKAASLYLTLASNLQTPDRFRIQAMILGLKHLTKSEDTIDTDEISITIMTLICNMSDYRVALDAARQLSFASPAFAGLREAAALKGRELADSALTKAKKSSESLQILEYISRRYHCDLQDYTSVIRWWSILTEAQKIEMRTTGGALWYDYCALIIRSLARLNRPSDLRSLAASILDGDSASPEGCAIVGIEYAQWLMEKGERVKAFEYFAWIALEALMHRKAAKAHYWLALQYSKSGKTALSMVHANAIRRCYKGSPSLLEDWKFDAKAIMILSKGEITTAISNPQVTYTVDFLERMLLELHNNQKRL